jgi:hypothetical protein
LTDPEITKIITGYIVMRGDKKIGGPFHKIKTQLFSAPVERFSA